MAYEKAVAALTQYRDKLDAVAEELLKKETLEGEDFQKLVGPKGRSDGQPVSTAPKE
ncbi:ATP-dependent zinc metalloprotease FtsH [compost metagenome]